MDIVNRFYKAQGPLDNRTKIFEALNQGMSTEEIANTLGMSLEEVNKIVLEVRDQYLGYGDLSQELLKERLQQFPKPSTTMSTPKPNPSWQKRLYKPYS